MGRFVGQLRALAVALGAPGLFLVAFLDSSFLSLPEIADLLVVYMVMRHKSRLILYAASATLGSLAGCVILYIIAKKGGEALIKRRVASASVDKTLETFRKYGVMAVLIPSLLPPPAPFKIFVLLAGAAGISLGRFSAAIAIGRGVRYFAIGVLAVRYGDQAIAYVHDHAASLSWGVAGGLAAALVAYLVWSKARASKRR
jgi:membrane protein YqaA with SNARE-associated domain